VDFALFLIACDDGVMPQTIEHKEIFKLLGINKGIIVLSKRDLVDEERIMALKDEINTVFDDGFFENFPFIEVSSHNHSSYKNLYDLIILELSKIFNNSKKNSFINNSFRLDIDKIYSPKGVGTIVSGTTNGSLLKSDTLTLFPQNIPVKIKGMQIHGKDCIFIEEHQRCALNITGVSAKEIERGNLLTNSKSIVNSKILDVLFIPISKNNLPKNNTKIRLHIGTGEYYGKIKYLQDFENKDILFQLIMEKEIPVDFNEVGILRTLSTSLLIGGIRVLKPQGSPTKKNNKEYLAQLKYLLKNELNISEYLSTKDSFVSIKTLNSEFNLNISKDNLKDDIFYFEEFESLIYKDNLVKIKIKIDSYLEVFHKNNPLKKGISISTINNLFFNGLNVNSIFKEDYLFEGGFISHKNFKIKLTKDEKKIKDEILILLKKEQFNGLNKSNLQEQLKNKIFKDIFNFLLKDGFIISLNETFILKGFYNEAINKLNSHFESNASITLSEFRDLLGCSRKIALLFLENFDKNNITKKIDDYRVKIEKN
ncbi:MAG: SelB C-terminal domain-containing protein, partial [Cetobacterium sp.]